MKNIIFEYSERLTFSDCMIVDKKCKLKFYYRKKYNSFSSFHFKACGSVADANSNRYENYERK